MQILSILTLVAIAFSPVIAVAVGSWLQNRSARRLLRLDVYRTLMATRAARLEPAHVNALNRIDLEFNGESLDDKQVREKWRAYQAYLSRDLGAAPAQERAEDLFVELLVSMSRAVGYDFDATYIRQTAYFPRGHGDAFADQLAIRRGLAAILEGKSALPVLAFQGPAEGNVQHAATRDAHAIGGEPSEDVTRR